MEVLYPFTCPLSEMKYIEYGLFLPNKLYTEKFQKLCASFFIL